MKKWIAMMLMLVLICVSACAAMAEGIEAAFAGQQILLNEKTDVDLDGDGAPEQVLLQMEGADGEEELVLYVFGTDGGVQSSTMYVCRMVGAFAADLDGDGTLELLVSGDFFSDDYCTYAYHYSEEVGLTQLSFANVERGEVTQGYADYGYGMVTLVNGEEITLTGSQDVLGTWMSSRVFALKDGQFETVDDGLWHMVDLTEDAEMWEYRSLIPMKQIHVQLLDGSEGALEAGEAFFVTASDKVSIVYFETRDGKTGSFEITPDVESGWGSLIDGESENEYFEFVPYAD